VKFHQEGLVRRVVAQAVRDALLRFHTARDQGGAAEDAARAGVERSNAVAQPAAADPETLDLPDFPAPLRTPSAVAIPGTPAVDSRPPALERERRDIPSPAPASLPARAPNMPVPASGAGASREAPQAAVSGEPVPLLHVPLRLLGVIGQLYVVLESDRGLVLLDQHAAHERILFEQTLNRLQQGNAPSQRLLLPETIELSPRDAEFLREQLPSLTRLGVGLSEFGDRTFLLDALPPFVRVADARRFVVELVDNLKAAGDGVNAWRLGEQTVAKTVCRHAVKANDPLAGPELENLVNDLRQCTMPYTCPHGRPTLIEMSFRELDKKFGRSA
jgi:DNA mismatch repair protein MutL